MKKLISTWLLTWIVFWTQAQILTPVKWQIKLDDSGAAEKAVVFTATADKGWHLYDMNLPEGGPISTSFTFETLTGAELVGTPTASATPTTVHDEQFGMDLRWYAGTVTFTQKFKVTEAAKFKMEGQVEFMACNDETCLPPDQIDFSFDKKSIRMDATATADPAEPVAEEAAETTEPAETTASEPIAVQPATIPVATPAKSGTLTDNPSLWTPVIEQLKAFGDSTVSAADTSWLFIFFAGFLGGL
ncbi:MAG: protein-disulfide reductase DsbD domain-containing protein, partial [Parabacteroides sp.]